MSGHQGGGWGSADRWLRWSVRGGFWGLPAPVRVTTTFATTRALSDRYIARWNTMRVGRSYRHIVRRTSPPPRGVASGRVDRCSGRSVVGCLPAAAAPDLRRQACRHFSTYGQTILRSDERMIISSYHISNDCASRVGGFGPGGSLVWSWRLGGPRLPLGS